MKQLIERPYISANPKASLAYEQLNSLLNALTLKALPIATVELITIEIEQLNSISSSDASFLKAIKRRETNILKLVEKKHKIVPIHYYRKLWMVLGMSVFGLPLGAAFGLTNDNMGMLGIGLPIGMAIGLAVGSGLDKKALAEGRQLGVEIK